MTRVRLIASTSLMAAGAWLIARWLVTQLVFSPGFSGIAAFCTAWVALYPLARRNRNVPPWTHWARGGFVLIVFWLMSVLTK